MPFDVNSLGYNGGSSASSSNEGAGQSGNGNPATNLNNGQPENNGTTELGGSNANVNKSTENGGAASSEINPNPNAGGGTPNTEPKGQENNNGNNGNGNNGNNQPTQLAAGTKLEVEDKTYTIDDKGNAVDAEGNIFKKAEEVSDWIKSFEVENPSEDNTLENIQKALDVEITDESGKPIEYENTPAGIQQYVNDVVETAREEIASDTIKQLYAQFPFAKDIIDYYVANGNSLDGYGVMPDRSGIEIDDNNVAQQEAIIRTAWKENGQKGDVERYIKYLKDSNSLAETAKAELAGLQEKDENARKQLEAKAAAKHQQDVENEVKYWQSVKDVIDSKNIGGYQISDTIVRNINGQKQSATLNDFYNYIHRTDKDGLTEYNKDLLKRKPEDALASDILQAYLTFTGGDYTSLVKKAVNENNVNTLRLKAATRQKTNTMKITPPANNGGNQTNENFGY